MKRDNRFRWALIIIFILASIYYLYPTFRYHAMDQTEKTDPLNADYVAELETQAIKRGLDLQGGVMLLYEINISAVIENLAINRDDDFVSLFNETVAVSQTSDQDFLTIFTGIAAERNIRLERYYDRDRRLDENNEIRTVLQFLQDEIDNGIRQALGILNNRINEFGVSEPDIHSQGAHRIVVALAGVDDIDRAKNLIGKTAQLSFKLLQPDPVVNELFDDLDRVLKETRGDAPAADITPGDTTQPLQRSSDQSEISMSELLGQTDTSQAASEDTSTAVIADEFFGETPFRAMLFSVGDGSIRVIENNIPVIEALLEKPEVQAVIPPEAELMFGSEPYTFNEQNYYELFVMKKEAELMGDVITDTRVNIGQDIESAGRPYVLMEMNRQGTREWARITGANVQKRIAIVLDNRVVSAPVVSTRIPDGSSRITGGFTMEEAKDLAIILRVGAFTAPLDVIQESTVGPSLGADSVRKGTYSAMIGLIMVAIFMIIYYRMAGSIADLAVILNLIFVMAILAGFHATLTLPGIAGLILTIGMAVDANVLIFERIREELLTGKTIRAAIDSGYSRAFFTILDANVTTLITAIVLYQYGTGPIKGFALTLSIGIICSMFTAIVFTRVVFDLITTKWKLKALSI